MATCHFEVGDLVICIITDDPSRVLALIATPSLVIGPVPVSTPTTSRHCLLWKIPGSCLAMLGYVRGLSLARALAFNLDQDRWRDEGS